MQLSSLSPGLVRIVRDDGEYLGIAVGRSGRTFGIRKLTEGSAPRGWIVRGREVERWTSTGVLEHDGSIYLYGEYVESEPLLNLTDLPEQKALSRISQLAGAMEVLSKNDLGPRQIHMRAVLFLSDGGVLFFADRVVESMTNIQDEPDRIAQIEALNHPDYTGPAGWSFAIAVLLYRTLTDVWPFSGSDEEEIHTHSRESAFIDPGLLRPELRTEIADFISEALTLRSTHGFDAWRNEIHEWHDSGLTRTISSAERSAALKKAQEASLRMRRRLATRERVRRHWKQAAVIAIAVVVVGSIPMSMLRNYLSPRRTSGMQPAEVVESFYYGMNDLDHDLMEDATVDGAGRSYIREVTNLFVVSRMRMSVEMDSGVVDPVSWTDQGRPPLESGQWIYGVVGLELEPIEAAEAAEPTEAAEGEIAFVATYERWAPDEGQTTDPDAIEIEQQMEFVGVRHEDTVRLRLEGTDWVIYSIETVRRDPIEPSS